MRYWFSKVLVLTLTTTLMFSALPSGAVTQVAAQGMPPLVVSLPTIWEDLVTPDMLAQFEAQYGADVIPLFTQNSFGFFGSTGTNVEAHLDQGQLPFTKSGIQVNVAIVGIED